MLRLFLLAGQLESLICLRAVELHVERPVFFLDEPTSGLDARSALIVMKEVKKVAQLGRTVISTIHQPSMEIFVMFDDMLLLREAAIQVFFGELGPGEPPW